MYPLPILRERALLPWINFLAAESLACHVGRVAGRQCESIPHEMGQQMDFDSTEILQPQLSQHFTEFLGEEVKVSKQEALFIATVIWTGAARPPRELSQVKP